MVRLQRFFGPFGYVEMILCLSKRKVRSCRNDVMLDKKMSSILYAGVVLVYQLAAVLDVVTDSATQGADGAWRQEAQVAYQGVHVPV